VASLGTSLTEEHAVLLSRYTENVVLIYDGDEAGQRAAQRAIPMLEKAGLSVKVLQLKDAKDPDEYLKKFGADKFRLLLNDSSNRVEYQLNAIRRKYDLGLDDQRVKFIAEAAEFVSTLSNAVQREIYGHRVAEAAGISFDALKIEVNKAYKRRIAREKKKQERIDLAPAANLQPRSRNIRYDNVKSAMAEETVLAMVLKSSALLDQAVQLKPEHFSSELLGRVYGQFMERHRQGLEVNFSGLELTGEEMSHVAGIAYRHTGPVNEQAFSDCIRTILAEHSKSDVSSADDLMAIREAMKNRKGIRQ
jgi:DNA primase